MLYAPSGGHILTGERVERRLAAVLAADVAGYSRLMGADEEGTLARLKAVRRDLVDPAIASHRGRIVKTTGDGLLVEFASAVDAARCAAEVQLAMAGRNADVVADQRIDFRIGIHVGDIIIDDNDIFGDGVNIAARLEGIAEPGGICISDDTQRQVRGKIDLVLDDLGAQTLKNIAEPMRAWRARLNGDTAAPAGQVAKVAALVLPDKPSIAVLPFQNMSGDPEQDYFADGIVEDIITALSRFKELFVIARNSSFTYKSRAIDIKQVGRELGVRYILEGSVRKRGGQVRITGQLIDAATGGHLWADKFDGPLADVFELQDEVTAKVVSAIAPALEIAEINRITRRPVGQPDAYELFLKGMSLFYQRRTTSTITRAYENFKKATEAHAGYASAHVMLGFCSMIYQAHTGVQLPPDRLEEALRSVEKAATLDEDDAFVQARAGHVLVYLGQRYDLGFSLVDRAVDLNSNLAPAWYSRGAVSVLCERPQDAIQSFDRMMSLSPRDPLLIPAWYMSGWAHFIGEDYLEGMLAADKAVQRVPDVHSLSSLIANAIRAGRIEDARRATERLLEFQPDFRASHAHHLFPVRSSKTRARIQAALHDAGLSDR